MGGRGSEGGLWCLGVGLANEIQIMGKRSTLGGDAVIISFSESRLQRFFFPPMAVFFSLYV